MSYILIPSLWHMVYWGQMPLNKYWNNNILLENFKEGSCTTSLKIPSSLNYSMKTELVMFYIRSFLYKKITRNWNKPHVSKQGGKDVLPKMV